jgi:hypothetical protein
MPHAYAISAEPGTAPRSFRSTNEDGSPCSEEQKERGGLPRIRADDLPALRQVLGMGADWTACPIPGHRGLAALGEHKRGLGVLCDCLSGRRTVAVTLRGTDRQIDVDLGDAWPHWYALPDVYLAVKTGRTLERWFRTPYRGAYRLLLNAELRLIDPAPVRLPDVPVSETAGQAAGLFARLYAAQVAAGFPEPGLLAVRLVAEWCGCGVGAAHAAIRELVDASVLVRAGEVGRAFRYRPAGVVVPIRGVR